MGAYLGLPAVLGGFIGFVLDQAPEKANTIAKRTGNHHLAQSLPHDF